MFRSFKPLLVLSALAFFVSTALSADNQFATPTNLQVSGTVLMCINGSSKAVPCSSGTPLQVTGGGGGGGGDASAANQTSQITQETAINTVLGTKADAKSTATDTTSISTMQVLKQISASVQAPPSQAVTNVGTFAVQSTNTAGTTGGCTLGKTLSAASTNATSVKGSAGTLCSLTVINTTATLYYLKFYDKATAATCNSDTVLQTIPVPASLSGAGVAVPVGPYGWAFPTGITFCLTGALADNDNTNAATGVAINYSYK